ncbi:hypothetical protein KDW_19390 [Dictyobacter vulcani]|uniref:Uncharacterized protein n=1 Tax=Dictyobacter vulcani TaxID=2607529 RepID=A0A5J4KMX0_9CHLR|nr:hypothetical protein [Dictyobacter vulcani]GER87777.1 hypothetical protein KDW_19390 [Dictyobacter vulcani]
MFVEKRKALPFFDAGCRRVSGSGESEQRDFGGPEKVVGKVLDKAQQICDTTATRDKQAEMQRLIVPHELRFVGTLTTEEWKAEQQLEQHESFLVSCQFDPTVCKYSSDHNNNLRTITANVVRLGLDRNSHAIDIPPRECMFV